MENVNEESTLILILNRYFEDGMVERTIRHDNTAMMITPSSKGLVGGNISSVEKPKQIHEKYFEEAKKLKERGDLRQAGEKLWGATTALIKHYAAIKNVFIAHWGRGKIDNFIASNVEEQYKDLFRNLLDNAEALHENFYEGDLSEKAFEERWRRTLKLLEEVRKIVFK
jgi:hypothetical protein